MFPCCKHIELKDAHDSICKKSLSVYVEPVNDRPICRLKYADMSDSTRFDLNIVRLASDADI